MPSKVRGDFNLVSEGCERSLLHTMRVGIGIVVGGGIGREF
jgi:hypothetical protein